MTLPGWHRRYAQQARWTKDLRTHLYARAGLNSARRVLEVGCGTGVLLSELSDLSSAAVYGVDIDASRLSLAARNTPRARLYRADAHSLPFTSETFDVVLCHYLLLWLPDPARVLAEMRRVTRPGGAVLALAEPDYGGRIDHPAALIPLGPAQQLALRHQGAEPQMGRRLARLFAQTGLDGVETGVLAGQWQAPPSKEDWELEWEVLLEDLEGQIPGQELERLRRLDWAAWQSGERVLFLPTFYACGRRPA
jgi:SAM-dependent methyltransferase